MLTGPPSDLPPPVTACLPRPKRRQARLGLLAAVVLAGHGLLLEATPWHLPVRSLPQGAPSPPALNIRPLTLLALPRPASLPEATPPPKPAQPAPASPPQRLVEGAPRGAGDESPVATSGRAENAADLSGLATQMPDLPEPNVESARLSLPGSLSLSFRAERGGVVGDAQLELKQETSGSAYSLQWRVSLPGKPEVDWASEGELSEAGLRPGRMVERKRGRDSAAVNFQRDKGLVSFSGPRGVVPLAPGVQDRASWLVQLPLLAQASAETLNVGTGLRLPVATVRGELLYWLFIIEREDSFRLPDGTTLRTWVLVRDPERPYDTRIEVALARDRGHWPLELRWGPVPGNDLLTLSLREGLPPAPTPEAAPGQTPQPPLPEQPSPAPPRSEHP